MTKTCNINATKKCAFCKFWCDFSNSAIEPDAPARGYWKLNTDVKAKCIKTNCTRCADNSACKDYVCKIPH